MNPLLAEAMRPTLYNQDITPPSIATGKADEKPIEPVSTPRRRISTESATPSHEQVQARPVRPPQHSDFAAGPRPAESRRVRETSAEDFEDNFTEADLMDPTEKGPTKHRSTAELGPDPFPLQYRKGDPDKDWDVSGEHGDD